MDILVTVIVNVGKAYCMSLLQVPEAPGGGDILKRHANMIPEHTGWNNRGKIHLAGTQVKIKVAIIVEVTKICTHGIRNPVDLAGAGNINEGAISLILVQPRYLGLVILTQVFGHHILRDPAPGHAPFVTATNISWNPSWL